MSQRTTRALRLFFLALCLGALACDAGDITALVSSSKPIVIISSPPSGSIYHEGEDVAVQSTSSDSRGITRVELSVDGVTVNTAPSPSPQPQFALIQTWKATPGLHTLTVRAYNTANAASDPAAISINVAPAVALNPTPSPVPTAAPASPSTSGNPTSSPSNCTNDAAFVADVTVPPGTVLAGGQTFNKIWRVRNTGSCNWGVGYDFALVGGEGMGAPPLIALPSTAPGATADLLVAMTAPTSAGVHSAQWRLRANAMAFGATLTVSINVPPAAPPCPGPPVISTFTASPSTITAGSSTTLSWGAVSNATSATIDHGIGGIATPGNRSVSPTSTTTYVLTATGCGGVATSQVTVNVNPALPPPVAVIYDFIAKADFNYASSKWQSTGTMGSFDLPFPGSDVDTKGFALWRSTPTLNDGSTPGQVLETHPQWTANGTISRCYRDLYTSGYQVQSSDRLSGKVGFIQGGAAGDVTFKIRIRAEALPNNDIVSIHSVYADGVKSFNVALATINGGIYNGKKADFCLIVEAGTSAAQDWAVWENVRIIR